MRIGVTTGIGLAVGVLAGCSGESAAPPAAPPSVTSSPVQPTLAPAAPEVSAPADGGFRRCLVRQGVRLPEDEHKNGNEEKMRTAIEACASLLAEGEIVRIPVVEGSAFQRCLARNGVKLPAPGAWLRIDRREDRVMDAALQRC